MSNKQKQNKKVMKITGAQIQKGMKIKVSKINDRTDFLINAINGVAGYGIHSEEEKVNMQTRILENKVLFISNGSVKKDSPVITVLDVQFSNSNGSYYNGKLCVNNQIWLVTDKGYVEISTKQKVELV